MSTRSKILVLLQFSCLIYFGFFTNFVSQGIFLLFQIGGFVLSLWAVMTLRPGKFNIQPELKTNANFIISGPYRLIRNPMYAGLILFFGASTIDHRTTANILVFLLFLIVLVAKIHLEEHYLGQFFGEDYFHYKERTYRLIPFLY